MSPIRVLIADDAVVVRRLLASVIDADPELEVVGVAQNGAIAITKFQQLQPDVITLDIEMPELDGLGALAAIRKLDRNVPIIMFSTLTERGGVATLEALSLGASDYVTKPANVGSVTAAMERVREDLVPRIKALCRRPGAGGPSTSGPRPATGRVGSPTVPASAGLGVPAGSAPAPAGNPQGVGRSDAARPRAAARTEQIDIVAIGASTGGPVAVAAVLNALPADIGVPVVITQHMPAVFTRLLAQRINGSAAIEVCEAADGDVLRPGVAYVAPGDFHMTLHRNASSVVVRLNQDEPVNYCRPAVDVMFRSVADVYGGRVLAVVLTGMGHDGRDGSAALRDRGAQVIAQDEATSVVWGMPGAVTNEGLADEVLALPTIGPRIARALANTRIKVGAR